MSQFKFSTKAGKEITLTLQVYVHPIKRIREETDVILSAIPEFATVARLYNDPEFLFACAFAACDSDDKDLRGTMEKSIVGDDIDGLRNALLDAWGEFLGKRGRIMLDAIRKAIDEANELALDRLSKLDIKAIVGTAMHHYENSASAANRVLGNSLGNLNSTEIATHALSEVSVKV